MLAPEHIGTLTCAAASGLVLSAGRFHIVADDCTRLHVYDATTLEELPGVALLPDALPAEPRARKAAKPDLEMLTLLPDARMLALGSGSTPRRARGVVFPLPAQAATRTTHDLSPLYADLTAVFAELNLEGACVTGEVLRLFQRGNGEAAVNALVDLELAAVLEAIASGAAWGPELILRIHRVHLGALPGGPLGFTDAATLPDGDVLFTAVAEGGGSTYDDGAFGGAALGRLTAAGALRWLAPLQGPHKVEGITLSPRAEGGCDVFMVADADDPAVPAPLLRLHLDAATLAEGPR